MSKLYFSFLIGEFSHVCWFVTIILSLFLIIYLTVIYFNAIINGINPLKGNNMSQKHKKSIKILFLTLLIACIMTIFIPSKREMMSLYAVRYLEEYNEKDNKLISNEYLEVIEYLTKEHPKQDW